MIFISVRLSKAARNIYNHIDMADLEAKLKASTARVKLIATDGVFSMDGTIAPLKEICDLADKYNAIVFIGIIIDNSILKFRRMSCYRLFRKDWSWNSRILRC